MAAGKEALFLFGDQTFDVEPHLPGLLDASNSNPVLRDFLLKAYNALRKQTFVLEKQVRETLPRFTSIEDVLLFKRHASSPRCVPFEMALLCLYQLASFIQL
jgi:hypothetical protein